MEKLKQQKLNIKIISLLVCTFFPFIAMADWKETSLDTTTTKQEWSLTEMKNVLKILIPQEAHTQYGGSIGYLSAGIGYTLWKDKGNLSAHFGFVPEAHGGAFSVIAIKLSYQPYLINIGNQIEWKPINPVFFPSYTLGSNFSYRFSTNQYRANYYFWSSALRLHLGASTEIKFKLNSPTKSGLPIKAISFYTEANTNDLYLISWFKNRDVAPITNLFKIGFGLKAHF